MAWSRACAIRRRLTVDGRSDGEQGFFVDMCTVPCRWILCRAFRCTTFLVVPKIRACPSALLQVGLCGGNSFALLPRTSPLLSLTPQAMRVLERADHARASPMLCVAKTLRGSLKPRARVPGWGAAPPLPTLGASCGRQASLPFARRHGVSGQNAEATADGEGKRDRGARRTTLHARLRRHGDSLPLRQMNHRSRRLSIPQLRIDHMPRIEYGGYYVALSLALFLRSPFFRRR